MITKDFFQTWRYQKRMTQKEMAEWVEVPLRTWQNWELGYRKPAKLAERYLLMLHDQ